MKEKYIEGLDQANARIRELIKRGYITARELHDIHKELCGINNLFYNESEPIKEWRFTPPEELK